MALTQKEIDELKEDLLGRHNEMSQDGLIIQIESNLMGDVILSKCGRIRQLLAKL